MKYLRTYTNLFESGPFVKIDTEIKDYLHDIFLELEDEGFDVDISRYLTFNIEEHPGFSIRMNRSKTFLLEDVYEYILTCKSYLKEIGFFITEINGTVPANGSNGPWQERYGLDYGSGLHESDPEKFKLFDKPLIRLEFKIRKEE